MSVIGENRFITTGTYSTDFHDQMKKKRQWSTKHTHCATRTPRKTGDELRFSGKLTNLLFVNYPHIFPYYSHHIAYSRYYTLNIASIRRWYLTRNHTFNEIGTMG
jgi:hypothetical protein